MSTSSNPHIRIFDTTLRDGEQSPGASMTHNEKLELAELMETMGVDVIEAGFPAASEGDFAAVSAIAEQSKSAIICGLARSTPNDIDRCAEAVKKAARPRIHTFISTSPVHMKHKLKMGPNAVLEAVGRSVAQARNHTDDVEWSAEDATRTDFDFLCKCIDLAIASGATTINLPDTVGYSHPDEYGALFRRVIETIPNSDKVIWSAHCHNDLGLAVANSINAVANGARQVECAINGLGERAGNAALEEIVMAMKVRSDTLPFETNIKPAYLSRASAMVSRITGFPVQYNKAIVGKNAFAHESGIHQDGMLKNAETYEIMRHDLANGIEDGIDRAIAARDGVFVFTIHDEVNFCGLGRICSGNDPQPLERDPLAFCGQLVIDEGDDVVIEDMLLAVGEGLEALERIIQRIAFHRVAERFQLVAEGVTAGMLAHDQ